MSLRAGEILTIPSPIDVHAHLREPGGEEKETIESGTRAALLGGYQAVYDMPNNPNGNQTWTLDRLEDKKRRARLAATTSIGFYAGVDLENPAFGQIPGLVRESAGLKLYMGHTTGNLKEHDLEIARPAIDEWIKQALEYGKKPPILLHAREMVGAETAQYIAEKGYPVHWCHIASETEAREARKLTKWFPDVYTGGVTPHHLTMTERNADFQQGWHGARMQPPLGTEVDAEMLLHAYNARDIQILETDHAPHSHKDKMRAEAENPEGLTDTDCVTCFGISGIEFVLPVMMALVARGKTDLETLVDSLHTQPIKMLGIKENSVPAHTILQVGPRVLTEADQFGKSGNHPYIGWTGWAKIIDVDIPSGVKVMKTGGSL